jgi:hypothetical protein
MRNAMPIRWIEQAEARQVIAAARFEWPPKAPWYGVAEKAPSRWLPRLGAWLAARHPLGSAVPQLQPALIRRPAPRLAHPHGDENGYCSDW